MLKAVELYCGIGGFAKACEKLPIQIKYAYDQNDAAISTYNENFSHKAQKFNLERFDVKHFESLSVDFLWMSPPCQPYTKKGIQKDIKDTRVSSFLTIIQTLLECKNPPTHIGLENVEGFQTSKAKALLLNALEKRGYNISEILLCPSEIGIPNRRLRYYLCASLKKLKPIKKVFTCKNLQAYINEPKNPHLISQEILDKFENGFRIIDKDDSKAYTTCFTSSYSKAWMHSGAYLTCKKGVRLFEANEIAHLMGFGKEFHFPSHLTKRQAYKLIGNSLSVYAVKNILTQFDLDDNKLIFS